MTRPWEITRIDKKKELDLLWIFEYPAAIFALNITLFTVLWRTIGLSWLPFGLADRFQEVFTGGYYPRDMETHETEYAIFFLILYGVLGTAAQFASLKIARIRRSTTPAPGIYRDVFGVFHILIATYHVLFVFQFVKGKMILDGMPAWQMIGTQVMYVLELVMAIELMFASRQTFFRRKVCLDVVSVCNLVPFLIYWAFAAIGFYDPPTNRFVSYSFFLFIPLVIMLMEWSTWFIWKPPRFDSTNNATDRRQS